MRKFTLFLLLIFVIATIEPQSTFAGERKSRSERKAKRDKKKKCRKKYQGYKDSHPWYDVNYK